MELKKYNFYILGFFLFCWVMKGFGLEPPRKGELEKYQLDGSLAQRIQMAQILGNHLFSPHLVSHFKARLQRLALETQGKTETEINQVMASSPLIKGGLPARGTVKVLAILIAFDDFAPSNSAENISQKLFGDGDFNLFPYESLRNYYRRSSYFQLEIAGNTLGWYTTTEKRSGIKTDNQGREDLIKGVLKYIDKDVGHDFSQYDNDGDGVIDYLIVIWTGPNTGWGNFWWAYKYDFSDPSFRLDGKQLKTYSWQWESEWQPPNSPGIFWPRTLIHETGHALGLPDYYDYEKTVGPGGGVGGLDMMAEFGGDHNCFSKFLLDWITPTVFNSGNHEIKIRPSALAKDAVLFMPTAVQREPFSDYPYSEFFMIQNRRKIWNDEDPHFADNGLLIWHVDATLKNNGDDFLFDNSYTDHKLLRLMEADGKESIETANYADPKVGCQGDAGDYYRNGDVFGPQSTPNSNYYSGNGTYMGIKNISELVENDNWKMKLLISGISIIPTATRIDINAWLFQLSYGVIEFSVDKSSENSITNENYVIFRKENNGIYQSIKFVSAADLQNGKFTYIDKIIERNKGYSYYIAAELNTAVIGISDEVTL